MEEEENGSLTSCCPTDDGICTSGSEGRPGAVFVLFVFVFVSALCLYLHQGESDMTMCPPCPRSPHIWFYSKSQSNKSSSGVRGSVLSLTSADDAGSE